MQALTIILGMILAVIGGYELGKRTTMARINSAIKELTKGLQDTANKLKEAKGDNHESTEER